ncbi:MAG: SDR family oxidoreductase [Bacteroidia bacterium]|nr:SDR family oxidoreductase [Bacteroidia bacterium]
MRVLVTGGAGFIGSNLTEALLQDERITKVRVLDNLSTGLLKNIQPFLSNPKMEWIQGDIRDWNTCLDACKNIDAISHQAALGSVPRSINDPITTNAVNISGALNIFTAAKENSINKIVYAASSSTYGDSKILPKTEDKIGKPLSPYAITKLVNELYADVFHKIYGIHFIGLRYFNVFGPKQNPQGAYAAVIPLFAKAVLNNTSPYINGDGLQSRDFTYVSNAVQANLLALFTENQSAWNQVYNIACGEQNSINDLFNSLVASGPNPNLKPIHREERAGDVRDSLADISKARKLLNYQPNINLANGLKLALDWYNKNPDYFL